MRRQLRHTLNPGCHWRLVRLCGRAFIALFFVCAQSQSADFERDVAPIIVARCLECHQDSEASGGLVLTTAESLARGGDSGAVIDPDGLDASRLWQRVSAGEMPPPKHDISQQLPPEELAVVRDWIAAGAPWPEARVLDP